MEIKLLTDRYGFRQIIEEERNEWLSHLLEYLGVDASILEEEDQPEIVDFLFQNRIEIIDFPELGAVEVSFEKEVVGEWGGPEFLLRMDEQTGELYYEVTIECWSVLDKEIDLE